MRTIAKLQHKWRNKTQVFLLGYRPKDGQIAGTAKVHAAEMTAVFRQCFQMLAQIFLNPAPRPCFCYWQGPVNEILCRFPPCDYRNVVHAGFNHGCREISAGRPVRDAEKLLLRAIAVCADKFRPPVVLGLFCPLFFGHLANAPEKAVMKRVIKRYAMQGIGQVAGPDILDYLVEGVFRAIVG